MSSENMKTFFELLCENQPDEMLNYLLAKGKGPKPVCPIEFVRKEKNENDSESKEH